MNGVANAVVYCNEWYFVSCCVYASCYRCCRRPRCPVCDHRVLENRVWSCACWTSACPFVSWLALLRCTHGLSVLLGVFCLHSGHLAYFVYFLFVFLLPFFSLFLVRFFFFFFFFFPDQSRSDLSNYQLNSIPDQSILEDQRRPPDCSFILPLPHEPFSFPWFRVLNQPSGQVLNQRGNHHEHQANLTLPAWTARHTCDTAGAKASNRTRPV